MLRFALVSLVLVALLFALDLYVLRRWRRYAAPRPRLRWTVPVFRVTLFVMPWVLPVYFLTSEWWAVEPKLLRWAVIGGWALYYVPRAVIAAVLALVDAGRFVTWLFGWLQERLAARNAEQPADAQVDLAHLPRMPRRDFVQTLGWTAATVPFALVGYSVFKTLYDFAVHRVDVPIAGLPRQLDGLTIAQLSDLHAGSFFSGEPMREAVHIVNGLRPDLVLVTGDFVNHDAAELSVIAPALHELRAELGLVGSLGNHDHYARVADVVRGVRETPVDLLVNEHRTLQLDGARLHLVGIDNTGFRQHFGDLPKALKGTRHDGDEATVLLAHDPTFWDEHVRGAFPQIDLQLSGHTHGGQVGFEAGPLRWGLARVVYKRWAGLYSEARLDGEGGPLVRPEAAQHLYVNRGLGTVGPPLRLGIRPEITLLTLRRV